MAIDYVPAYQQWIDHAGPPAAPQPRDRAARLEIERAGPDRDRRLVGLGAGCARRVVLLRTWRGHGPHNCLVWSLHTGYLVVPVRRLRRLGRGDGRDQQA